MLDKVSPLIMLIQAALSHKEKSEQNITLDAANQNRVIELSFSQGVSSIACDGFNTLPANIQDSCISPDDANLENERYEWLGSVITAENDYAEHTKTLWELINLFGQNGIKILLLKGIGLSKYYPIPNHRPCGDIDVYSYGQRGKVAEIISNLGIEINQDSEKHDVFEYNGIMVESHGLYLDSYQTRHETKVQDFLNTLSDDILTEDGYYTPSPLKNYFFLLCHMSRHFSEFQCITLRHLLDWGLFLDGEKANLNPVFIKRKLQEFNLGRCNDIFTSLAQDITGRDLSVFVFHPVDEAVKYKFLNAILSSKERSYPEHLIPRILCKAKIFYGNHWKYKYLGFTFGERILWAVKTHLSGRFKI